MSRKKSNIRNILHKKIDNHSNIEKSTMYFKKYCERNLEIKFTISCLNLVVLKKKKKKKTENWRRSINSFKKKVKEKKVMSHESFIMVQNFFAFVWHWLTLQTDEWNLETKHSKDDAKFALFIKRKILHRFAMFSRCLDQTTMYVVSPLIWSLSYKDRRFKLYHSIANNKNDFVFYK